MVGWYLRVGDLEYFLRGARVYIPKEQRVAQESLRVCNDSFVLSLQIFLLLKGSSSTVPWTSLGNPKACSLETCLTISEVAMEHDIMHQEMLGGMIL